MSQLVVLIQLGLDTVVVGYLTTLTWCWYGLKIGKMKLHSVKLLRVKCFTNSQQRTFHGFNFAWKRICQVLHLETGCQKN